MELIDVWQGVSASTQHTPRPNLVLFRAPSLIARVPLKKNIEN
jgi:hypothetical protein